MDLRLPRGCLSESLQGRSSEARACALRFMQGRRPHLIPFVASLPDPRTGADSRMGIREQVSAFKFPQGISSKLPVDRPASSSTCARAASASVYSPPMGVVTPARIISSTQAMPTA